MGRKLKFNEQSKILTMRVPESKYNEIKSLVNRFLESKDGSEYRIQNNNIESEILKKMIPKFMEKGIEIDLDNNEIKRVKELYAKI